MDLIDFQHINMTRRPNFTRLIVILLWSVLASIHVQELYADDIDCTATVEDCRVSDPAPDCGCNQYLDESEDNHVCRNCTDCCSDGKAQIEPCSKNQDAQCSACVPGAQFYDRDVLECKNCTVCREDEQRVTECSISKDTLCTALCQTPQYYAEGRCHIDCSLCPSGCVTTGTARCRCQPSNCYHDTDITCKNNICGTTGTTPIEVTGTVGDDSNELPTWGIGLISIGVVIGIVAFSAGSMILGFCTRRTSQVEEDVEQASAFEPKPSLVSRYGQPNPFLHHNANHPAIDMNRGRYSPNAVKANGRNGSLRNGSLRANSVRNSPKALRSMSAPRVENATPI